MLKPELLAPAGGWDAMVAAVQCGADAVYLGVGAFNARQPAENFTFDTLKAAVRYCTLRGVRVYVTLNTMVFDGELDSLTETIDAIAFSGAHGVLVQDFGVLRLLKARVPDLPLHASTQMAAHNVDGVRFLRDQGFARVVLAREMPLEEIKLCAQQGVEVEVFAHGALCVSGSGQCLFSSVIGGRSANRGRCAQPCRLPYRLNGTEGHLLSCRDLCTINMLEELIDVGVHSLKLEGRLKRPEYVAVVTKAYREAIDHPEKPIDIAALQQMFNRGGFTSGYLKGVEEEKLIYPERPNHIGLKVGEARRDGQMTLLADIDRRDTLAIGDRPVHIEGKKGKTVPCREAKKGNVLNRLVSERQMEVARSDASGERRVTALSARLTLRTGDIASLSVTDGTDIINAQGPLVEKARTRGVDPARAVEQIGKTGGTPWRFETVETDIDADAFLPMAALNQLRRDALAQWEEMRAPKGYRVNKGEFGRTMGRPYDATDATSTSPSLWVESGDILILHKSLDLGADAVVFRPNDLRHLDIDLPEQSILRLPSMLPENTQSTLHQFALRNSEHILATIINNIGSFDLNWPGRIIAGEGLNIANAHAVRQMLDWGANGYIPSLECTSKQIGALPQPEAIYVYGRMTLMHLRHCPYRTARGAKDKHADCRYCDGKSETGTLIDRKGVKFPLKRIATDAGCVLELRNAHPLMLLNHIKRLPRSKAWIIQVDDINMLEPLMALHQMALNGEDFKSTDHWDLISNTETTTGHYFRPVE